MKKYKIPQAFAVHIDSDPGLQQLLQDGQESNRPESEFYKAALAYTLDTRRNLLIELGRYIQQYGPLEPIDYDTGATINSPESEGIKAEAEVPETPQLKVLPKPEEEPTKRFTKSYGEEDQS